MYTISTRVRVVIDGDVIEVSRVIPASFQTRGVAAALVRVEQQP